MFRNAALLLPLFALAIYLYDLRRPDPLPAPAAPGLELVAGKSRIQSSYSGALEGDALEAYRTWQSETAHYGAFAVSDFGDFGWVSKYNDLAHAETTAIAFCGLPDCRVIARSLPLTSAGPGERVVSERTMQYYFDYLQMRDPKAFAIAPNGATGWFTGARSLSNARKSARAACQSARMDAYFPEGLVQPDCILVHSTGH